ncbi:chromosome condensation regulator, partial [Xanthomonas citri pv. citri]|nr:chromosome condensation regulator [Xanthomonas citri pv. citri]
MTGQRGLLAAGRRHSLVVVDGGRVLAAGPPGVDECAVAGWSEVVAVAAGNVHGARNTGRSHSVG